MLAKDLMTTEVVMVGPDASTREIARILLDNGISAVPVVDSLGALIGMVSEGDIIGRDEADRIARRDWWLGMMAGEEEAGQELLESLSERSETARDVMAAPVITVTEDTDVRKIAQLLTAYRIKRVPVVRGGDVVGILSRGDLLQVIAAPPSEGQAPDARRKPTAAATEKERGATAQDRSAGQPQPAEIRGKLEATAEDFRELSEAYHREQVRRREEARLEAERQRQELVQQMAAHQIEDQKWRDLLVKARVAAENGKKQMLLLRFPSQLCSDNGRMINAQQDDWPRTLRGEAAGIYLRWEHSLKPRGFQLTAQVLDFPGGFPGNIGLFLVWDS